MKKQTKYIIITLAILVLLGGVLALLLKTSPSQEEGDTSSAESGEKLTLISKEENDIESISVKNTEDEFTIVPVDADSEIRDYTIKGYEKYELTTAEINLASSFFATLPYTKELGKVDDPSSYGLDGSVCVTAKYKDGTETDIQIGMVPGESSGRYILYDGKVYISDISEIFVKSAMSRIQPASWQIQPYADEQGTQYSILNNISLSGTNFERDIKMEYNDDDIEYDLIKPVPAKGSNKKADEVAKALLSFSTSDVVKVEPTEEDIKDMGLADPYCQLDFTVNEISHSITLGNRVDNSRYCMVNGDKNLVYTVSMETVAPWAESEESQYRDDYILLKMIFDVSKLDITVGDTSCVIDFERTVNEEKSTEEKESYDYTAKVNGKDIEYESIKEFYADLISVQTLSIKEMESDSEPVATVVYSHYDGSEDQTLEFYKSKDNDKRYVCYLDGEYTATVRNTSVDQFMEDFKAFTEKYA